MKTKITDTKVSINKLSNELMAKIDELKQQYKKLDTIQKRKIIGGISAALASIAALGMIKRTVKRRKLNRGEI